jgi:hypothetical protein
MRRVPVSRKGRLSPSFLFQPQRPVIHRSIGADWLHTFFTKSLLTKREMWRYWQNVSLARLQVRSEQGPGYATLFPRIASCGSVPPLNPSPKECFVTPLEPGYDQEHSRPLDQRGRESSPFQPRQECLSPPWTNTTTGLSSRLGTTTKGAPLDTL